MKNLYVFAHKSSLPSARILATKLGLKVTANPNEIIESPIIRYGNSLKEFDNDTSFNSPSVIKLCSNSLLFSTWCLENNFLTPKYEKFDGINDNETYPFLLRLKWHRAGKDIIKITCKEDLEKVKDINLYFKVPYIESDYEIGVHVVLGRVVKIFKKIKRDQSDDNKDDFIRSSYFGWHYYLVSNLSENFSTAQKLAGDIVNKIGLNFGRLDMGYSSKQKEYIIYEINTAPGLNQLTAELYSTLLRETLKISS